MVRFLNRILYLCIILVSFNTLAMEANIPTLSTNGYAKVVAKPDWALFTVAIESENKQATQAKQDVDKVVEQLVSSLTQEGLEREDISSGNLQLSPQYSYPQGAKPTLEGYQAVRSITVRVEQLDKLNKLLDLSLAAGVNRVDNIQLRAKDEIQYKLKAREAAIADAKEKAKALAEGFDSQLDGVWSINYHSNLVRPVMKTKSMAIESRMIDQSYQDKSVIISDQVDVVFKLKKKSYVCIITPNKEPSCI